MLTKVASKAAKGRLLAQAAAEQVYANNMERAAITEAKVNRGNDRLKTDKDYLTELTRYMLWD